MGELLDALKRRYRSAEQALDALGLDHSVLDHERENNMRSFTRDRGFTTARRPGGRDEEEQEEGRREIREMLDSGVPADEIVAALVEGCPDSEREDLNSALTALAEDMRYSRRSPRQWAADHRERKRYAARDRARRARDGEPGYPGGPEGFGGMPERGGTMRPLEGEDRRRMAGDMAFDRSPLANFLARYPTLKGRIPERF